MSKLYMFIQYTQTIKRISWCVVSFITIFIFTDLAFAQKAVSFESPGDYMEVPHSVSLAPSEFTIEFWLKVYALGDPDQAGGEQNIIDKRSGETGYNLRLAGTKFPLPFFAFVYPGGLGTNELIEYNEWYHFAVTQDQDSLKIYFNGTLAAKEANTYASNTAAPLRIGEFLGYPGGYLGLRGAVDELRIWNTARSQGEVQSAMHEKLSGSEANLAAYWDFDSQSGSTVEDLSPNGNSGTLNGNAALIDSDAPIGFTAPDIPVGLRAFGDEGAIDLVWKADGSDAFGYEIYRGDSSNFYAGDESLLTTVYAPDSTFTDHSVESGRNYIYRLRAIDAQQHKSQPGRAALSRTLGFTQGYNTGVYYYPWYGPAIGLHEWDGAYFRESLVPAQPPFLGEYSSRDLLVIKQHLEWMKACGIDFLVSSWWGQNSREDITLRDYMLSQIEQTSVQFTVYYESLILGSGGGGIIMDGDKEEALVSDLNYIADTYFDHPNFLKIDGRPVVFIYLSRIYSGSFQQAFDRVRAELAAKGHDVFLVGDEVGWGESSASHMQFLDAVSPYIMFGNPTYDGYPLERDFFADISLQVQEWEEVAWPQEIKVIPDVHPGFNNNHGSSMNHMVAPRQSVAGAEHTSMLEEYIKVVRPFVDPDLKMIMITSWNEWHEDTQIEPTVVAPPTNTDISGVEHAYTKGYYYEGYGLEFLELVRKLLASEIEIGVSEEPRALLSEMGSIWNYPNPFQTRTSIHYQVHESGHVTLMIYNSSGQELAALVDGYQPAGDYSIDWDGKDNMGSDAASGLYLIKLINGKQVIMSKILRVR